MQFFPMNEEFPVSAGHKLALIKSLPFVHTARRYYRLDGLVRSSDRPRRGRRRPWRRSRKDDQTGLSRGSKSRNKVSVGEPAEGSLPSARAAETGAPAGASCASLRLRVERLHATGRPSDGRQRSEGRRHPGERDKVASQERRQQGRRARAPGRLRAGGNRRETREGERRERARSLRGGSRRTPKPSAPEPPRPLPVLVTDARPLRGRQCRRVWGAGPRRLARPREGERTGGDGGAPPRAPRFGRGEGGLREPAGVIPEVLSHPPAASRPGTGARRPVAPVAPSAPSPGAREEVAQGTQGFGRVARAGESPVLSLSLRRREAHSLPTPRPLPHAVPAKRPYRVPLVRPPRLPRTRHPRRDGGSAGPRRQVWKARPSPSAGRLGRAPGTPGPPTLGNRPRRRGRHPIGTVKRTTANLSAVEAGLKLPRTATLSGGSLGSRVDEERS